MDTKQNHCEPALQTVGRGFRGVVVGGGQKAGGSLLGVVAFMGLGK